MNQLNYIFKSFKMSEDDRQLVTGTDILPISEVSKGRTLYKVHNYSPTIAFQHPHNSVLLRTANGK